jgi:hypothetical protein
LALRRWRAQGLILVPALFLFWWTRSVTPPQENSPRLAIRAATLLAALAIALTPWTLRNAVRMHTFAPVATNLGLNLWIGNNPDATGAVMDAPVQSFDAQVSGLSDPQKEVEFDALARNAAVRYIGQNPLETSARAPTKIFETYRNDRSFASWYEPPGAGYLGNDTRRRLGLVSDTAYVVLLALSAAGTWLLIRAGSAAPTIPLAALVLWSLVTVIFFGDPRYHVPLLPLLAVPAAYAIARAFARAAMRISSRAR